MALLGSVAGRASGPPIDEIVSIDGQFLSVVNVGGALDTFAIHADGTLALVQSLPTNAAALNGVVAA